MRYSDTFPRSTALHAINLVRDGGLHIQIITLFRSITMFCGVDQYSAKKIHHAS